MISAASGKIINPFPGLRPFTQEESDRFFGRKDESLEIIRKLNLNRFVAVFGASGSGKSSLVNSGVVPELISRQKKGEPPLKIIRMTPGNNPLKNLSAGFAGSILGEQHVNNADDAVISHLKDNKNWIATACRSLMIKPGERVLIFVDQFEEVFRNISVRIREKDYEDALIFAGLLTNAVKQTDVDISVILSVRSDYIGECARFHELIEMMNNSNFLIPRMTRDHYREVIENPVRLAGADIDPDLVNTILDNLGEQHDQLPVLQHLMMRTFSCWMENKGEGRTIDITDYTLAGTLSGAISRHADEAYNELSEKGRNICSRLFRAITGKGSENRNIRNPQTFSALRAIIECSDEELKEVINKFRIPSRSFLIPGSNIKINDNSVVDLSHESIMRLWGRLKEWIEDEAVSVRMYRKLSEASAMYQQGRTTLLQGSELQVAINWRETQKPNLKWAERYDPAYERVMAYLRTSEKAYEEEELTRLLKQRKRVRRSRIIASVFGAAMLISLILFTNSFIQKKNTERLRLDALREREAAVEHAIASERVAIASRLQLITADSGIIAAREREAEIMHQKAIAENRRLIAEHTSEEAEKEMQTMQGERDVAIGKRMVSLGKALAMKSLFMPDERELQALLAYQGYIFNSRNGGEQNDADIYKGLINIAKSSENNSYRSFTGHTAGINSIAFVPGNREFFTAGSDGKIMRWGLDKSNQSLQIFYSGSEIINVLAVSPDAGWLASGTQNSGIRMIPLKDNGLAYDLKGHTGPIRSLIFSYDGRYLYSASVDGKVLRWDLNTKSSTEVSEGLGHITSIDLSADNNYMAGLNEEGKVVVWDPSDVSQAFRIESADRKIKAVRFKPDDDVLAVGYTDGYFELWDISSREVISEFKAHSSGVNDIRFNSKFSQLATASNDGSVKIWNTNDLATLPIDFDDNNGIVVTIEFSPDGQVIVTGTTGETDNLKSRGTTNDILAKDVRKLVTRNFSLEEWIAFVGKDIEFEATVPGNKYNIRVTEIK